MVARPLWTIGTAALVGVVFMVGVDRPPVPLWVLAAVIAGCVVAIALLYRRADRLRGVVRLADEQLGIPVPADLADDVVHASHPFLLVGDWYDEAESLNAEALAVLRSLQRRSRAIDIEFVVGLHRLRRPGSTTTPIVGAPSSPI